MRLAGRPGAGWIALIGGGEFSFGETEIADGAWLDKTPPGSVGFLPAASGSTEYGTHFATYLRESAGRDVEDSKKVLWSPRGRTWHATWR